MLLGDARRGKWPINLLGFARALRRAGFALDSQRIGLCLKSMLLVGVAQREDFKHALEAVLVNQHEQRELFRELFDRYFKDPKWANHLLTQMLPTPETSARESPKHARLQEALERVQPVHMLAQDDDDEPQWDAIMTSSGIQRLRQADFNSLGAQEYRLVQRLAQATPLVIPSWPTRRKRPHSSGTALHWNRLMQKAAIREGECWELPRLGAQVKPLPLLVLVDVSGSMERYARMLLAFLHQATLQLKQRAVFAFGTELTDLSSAFELREVDDMLAKTNVLIEDYASGTRLGNALKCLRQQHAHRLVAKRSLVLLISDGLDTGDVQELDRELKWLKDHSKTLLWLNPLLRYDAYEPLAKGAQVVAKHAKASLAIHHLDHLKHLTQGLEKLVRA